MKKIIAVLLVAVFSLSGLCLTASAIGVPELVTAVISRAIEDIKNGENLDFWLGAHSEVSYNVDELTPEQRQAIQDRLSGFAGDSKSVDNNAGASGNAVFEIYDYYDHHAYITIDRQAIYDYLDSNYPNFDYTQYYMVFYGPHRVRSSDDISTRNRGNRLNLHPNFFPLNTTAYSYYDDTNCYIKSNTSVTAYDLSLWIHTRSDLTAYFTAEGAPYSYSYKWNSSPPIENVVVNDLQPLEEPYVFTSSFSTANDTLTINLHCNKTVTDDLMSLGGIIYDDGTNRYDGTDRGFVNADYVDSKSLIGGTDWTWTYNLKDFTNWAYRKRILETGNFYGFVCVENNDNYIYYIENHIDLRDPTGIFNDVNDMPDWNDYAPTLISLPSIVSPTFNFNGGDTYSTIQNYTGNDFDFDSFFGWFNGAFVAMANNMAAFFTNAQAFFNAVAEFSVDGIVNAIADLGSLIDDLNLNLDAQYNSFGDFIGTIGDTLDHNLKMLVDNSDTDLSTSLSTYVGDIIDTITDNFDIINDNIENDIKNQIIPDKVYLDFILSDCLPWYQQIRDCLQNHDFNSNSVSLTVNFGQALGSHTFTYDDVEMASKIRPMLELLLLAGTALGCARIGFQTLGIDISKGKGGE